MVGVLEKETIGLEDILVGVWRKP